MILTQDYKRLAVRPFPFNNEMRFIHFSSIFTLKKLMKSKSIKKGMESNILFDDKMSFSDIEKDIVLNDQIYKPNILLTEEDYRVEGYAMKNCMSKQFPHGALYIFISLHHGRKRINLQYRKGNLIQSYGKANTTVPESYNEVIDILTERMRKYSHIEWKKEKYDLLTH